MFEKIRKIIILIILLIGFGGFGYYGSKYVKNFYHKGTTEELIVNEKTIVVVRKAKKEEIFEIKNYYGVIGREHIKVISTSPTMITHIISNNMNTIHKKDTIVCEFDNGRLIHELGRAKAELEFYSGQKKRMEILVKSGSISQSQLDEMISKEKVYTEEVKKYEHEIHRNIIKAPFDCVISQPSNLQPQTYVQNGQEIMTLYDINSIIIELRIPIRDREFILNSTPSITQNDNVIKGKIIHIAPKVQPTSNVLQVKICFDHKSTEFIVGQPVEIQFTNNSPTESTLIEEEAIQQSGVEEYVYIVRKGIAYKIKVTSDKTYNKSGKIRVYGINDGESVVVEGIARLRDFEKVDIIDSDKRSS